MINKQIKSIVEKIDDIQDYKYYYSPALAMFDTVMSVNTRYNNVIKALSNFGKEFNIPTSVTPEMPERNNQIKVSDIKSVIDNLTPMEIAEKIKYHGKCYIGKDKVSKCRLFVLKTAVFKECLNVLVDNQIETFQDINGLAQDKLIELENNLRSVKGINEKISYFFMLCGDDDSVMVDRHVRSFVYQTLQKSISDDEIKLLLKQAAKEIRLPGGGEMTPRILDHIIWEYMRNQ